MKTLKEFLNESDNSSDVMKRFDEMTKAVEDQNDVVKRSYRRKVERSVKKYSNDKAKLAKIIDKINKLESSFKRSLDELNKEL